MPARLGVTGGMRRVLGAHPFVLVPFVFYYLTCGRSLGSSDTALLIDEMRSVSLSTHANHHNLTILLGHLFQLLPGSNLAFKANLVSVFLGALAVAGFYGLAWQTFRSRASASLSALCLMVSHSMWWHSTIGEVYAWNALLTVVVLWLLHRLHGGYRSSHARALFFVAGLAVFNHVQMGVVALAAAALLALEVRRLIGAGQAAAALRECLGCSAAFAVGFAPYLVTFLVDARNYASVSRAASLALGGDFRTVMFGRSVPSAVAELLYLVFLQFPSAFLAAVPVGAWLLVQRWKRSGSLLALALMFLVNTGFFMFYSTWDTFAFLLLSFIILAYAGAFAIDRARQALTSRRGASLLAAAFALFSVGFPPWLYSRLSTWGRTSAFWHSRYGNDLTENSHDFAEYIANPNKRRYREYEDFVRLVAERLPRGAILVDDDSRMYYATMYYRKYYGTRPDLDVYLLNVWGFAGWGLTDRQFAEMLRAGRDRDLALFLVTIDYPFTRHVLQAPGGPYRFVRFDLDGRRWIYRLVTASEEARLAPAAPVFTGLSVGAGRDPAAPLQKDVYSEGDELLARIRFHINGEPFPIRFRWLTPERRVYDASDPITVPFGCRSAWARLQKKGALTPGRWKVEAFSGDRLAGEAGFEIR